MTAARSPGGPGATSWSTWRVPLRVRLTLWYAAVLTLVLGAVAATGYWFISNQTRAIADEFLAETADALADAIALERAGGTVDSLAVAAAVREFRFRDIAVAVYDAVEARPLAISLPVTSWKALMPADVRTPLSRAAGQGTRVANASTEPFTFLSLSEGEAVESRVGLLPVRVGPRLVVIVVAQRLRLRARVLAEARDALLIAMPLALLVIAAGGFLIARQGLRPIAVMRLHAERIEATTLHERLPVGSPPHDELGRMAIVFNALLERLDRAFDQQRSFMADASHELRTPVTVVRAEAEHALAGPRSIEELREALGIVHEESSRVSNIVDDLFLLARADAGDQVAVATELYLDDLIAECIHALRSLASAKSMVIVSDVEPDLQLSGDAALLRRLIVNLLDNAIKYTPTGGTVTVRAQRSSSSFRLTVTDTGPGIPAESQSRLFERFHRGTRERSPSGSAGAGLGLAIVRWVARLHRGDARLVHADRSGSTFEVTLRGLQA